MKEVLLKCDICKGTEKVEEDVSMTVIFETEQTEGRKCVPYFEKVNLDICKDCTTTILNIKQYIRAFGAQGYNDFTLEGRTNKFRDI